MILKIGRKRAFAKRAAGAWPVLFRAGVERTGLRSASFSLFCSGGCWVGEGLIMRLYLNFLRYAHESIYELCCNGPRSASFSLFCSDRCRVGEGPIMRLYLGFLKDICANQNSSLPTTCNFICHILFQRVSRRYDSLLYIVPYTTSFHLASGAQARHF
jgi:hypothetical protein